MSTKKGDSPLFLRKKGTAGLVVVLLLFAANHAQAQATQPTGHLSFFFDHLPNRDATELRGRAFVEEKADAGEHVRIAASGFVEGLVADRSGRVTDLVAEPQDLSVDLRSRRLDVTVGFTRIVWGRLDELQPTDVVNPLDSSRFFFEGRSEARLAVPLVRARLYAGEHASLEGIYVPFFRRGRFDRLDEPTSPFNLAPSVPLVEQTPARTFGNAQGGARFNATTGRVDWSVSAYRGFRPFGLYTLPSGGDILALSIPVHLYPRFTMIGGDLESVAGEWGFRAEVAAFVDDTFQVPNAFATRDGQSIDAGAGVDRKAGDYRISGSVILHRERYTDVLPGTDTGRTDTSIVLSADRTFAREKYQGRLFGVYNPSASTAFVRGIAIAKLRDDVAVEGSIGWFDGSGVDTIGRFGDRDFGYVRVKYSE